MADPRPRLACRWIPRWWRIPVTTRARFVGRLAVVPAPGIRAVVHTVRIPRGACPVSGNPLSGTLTLQYTPSGYTIEVVSLAAAMRWACSGSASAPRSVEDLAAWAAREAAVAVGVRVVAVVDVVVRPGRQRLRVEAACSP